MEYQDFQDNLKHDICNVMQSHIISHDINLGQTFLQHQQSLATETDPVCPILRDLCPWCDEARALLPPEAKRSAAETNCSTVAHKILA